MAKPHCATRFLAIAGIVGPIAFTLGWIVGASLQDDAYVSARHDISDLAALTARSPWVMLTGQGVAGVLTIAFAIGALRPLLAIPGRRSAIGPWLLAASLMGFDNISDLFFRLDCRAADAGCTEAVRTATSNGKIHMTVGLLTALVTVATPLVIARRLRLHPDWGSLILPTRIVGAALVLGLGAYISLEGRWGQGIAQRAMALVMAAWIAALAARATMATREREPGSVAAAPTRPAARTGSG